MDRPASHPRFGMPMASKASARAGRSFPCKATNDRPIMRREQLEDFQNTRTELWRLACHGKLTVEELYAELAKLRAHVGEALYDRRPQAKIAR